ncbi:MAG: translation initiation factor IF-3 [Candidatus Wildermuthbacteria bacterium]|nr:translation initiation factor IF-3 [Candidatus Wildermuthbacteria bacterium]
MQKRILLNNFIKAPQVRLIDEAGKQAGVVSLQEALRLAQQRGLDLIQVTEKVDPPVCRLWEYGKFIYHQQKKERESKKHTGGELKEIRLTFNISPHDIETRARQAEKFLAKGSRVRIVLRLRGREKFIQNIAREKMEKLLDIVKAAHQIKIEREVKQEPRGLTMIIAKA